MPMNEAESRLFALAKEHLKDSYSPYSHFQVAAALMTESGKTYTGVNIENSSFGLTNCAERTAMFNWVNDGGLPDPIEQLLIIGNTDRPISPCGACRQVMSEFMAPESEVILTDTKGEFVRYTVDELIPYHSTEKDIEDGANK